MRRVTLAVLAAAALLAASKGAGLPASAPRGAAPPGAAARDSEGYRLAVPRFTFRFPADHAAHPSFRTEWWYYTGHLDGTSQEPARSRVRALPRAGFGYECTFFRVALPVREPSRSAWRARDVIFMHLALTDEKAGVFRHFSTASRAALALAGADSTRYAVWLGDAGAGLAPDGRTHLLHGSGRDFGLALQLLPAKPPVAHGSGGVSQKTAGRGNASHYYSITRMTTRGHIVRGSDTIAVAGSSWMDHEFGSGRLGHTHTGWDWFSVQLEDGRELMLYRLRLREGGVEPLSSGTLVAADGSARHLALAEFDTRATGTWKSPHTGGTYPSGWVVRVPGEHLELVLEPTVLDQELVVASMGGLAYWEGSVRVRGTSGGTPVGGRGYVELTGYAGVSPF